MPKGTKPTARARRQATSEPVLSDRARGVIIRLCLVATVAGFAVAGFNVLRRHVQDRIAYLPTSPKVVFKNRPPWMSDYLLDRLSQSVRPSGPHTVFDHELLVDTAHKLSSNPWVLRVGQVRRGYDKRPGDMLEIDCDFRAPVALVKWQNSFWLVDNGGVKLPEEYTAQQAPKVMKAPDGQTLIRVIEGVRNPPPAAGQQWEGRDLAGGLDMIKLLFVQPYANDVIKINVANFEGQVDAREAQIVLSTRYGTEIRWGRPVNATDYFIEVPTAQKLASLQKVYQKYGRLDANKLWIDVRFENITYPSGGPPDPKEAQTAAAR